VSAAGSGKIKCNLRKVTLPNTHLDMNLGLCSEKLASAYLTYSKTISEPLQFNLMKCQETHPSAMVMFLFALVGTIILTLAVRSFLSCLCSDVEDFTHLFLLFMITGMFPNPIHRSETCNERYHCNIHMTACFTAI